MRYLVHESQRNELSGRMDFLYDVFHLYFLPNYLEGRYIHLMPLGHTDIDIMFITGHTDQVRHYLEKYINRIPETVIVATTCMPNNLKRYRMKKIYVPNIKNPFCEVRDGTPYGFKFNITDAELNMYKKSGDIMTRICAGYRLLK